MKSLLEEVLDKNLLKFAVGQRITCPDCGSILDFRRATLFSVALQNADALPQSGRTIHMCVCNNCASSVEDQIQKSADKRGLAVQVTALRGAPRNPIKETWEVSPRPAPAKPLGAQLELF